LSTEVAGSAVFRCASLRQLWSFTGSIAWRKRFFLKVRHQWNDRQPLTADGSIAQEIILNSLTEKSLDPRRISALSSQGIYFYLSAKF